MTTTPPTALPAPVLAVPEGWQPIDTVPEELCSGVIVASPMDNGSHYVEEAWRDEESGQWWPANTDPTDAHGVAIYPTHWMRLPVAPGVALAAAPSQAVEPKADELVGSLETCGWLVCIAGEKDVSGAAIWASGQESEARDAHRRWQAKVLEPLVMRKHAESLIREAVAHPSPESATSQVKADNT